MSKTVLNHWLKAKTRQDVQSILSAMKNIKWLPVGGTHTNQGIIHVTSNPMSGIIERVTNAIDAILEWMFVFKKKPTNIKSPRQAVEKWFGIPKGNLGNVPAWNALSASEKKMYTELAGNVLVTLQESGIEKRPTIEIRDKGIGIAGENFSSTILSLNKSNKIGAFHSLGVYGMGGSTSLAYSPYTIIVSREAFKENAPVSFTVVRYNPGNADTDKMGWYEYCVDKETENPIQVAGVDEEFFPHGTLVRMIEMDNREVSGSIGNPTGDSLWYQMHNALFNPVLPIKILGERAIDERRDNSENKRGMSVFGNQRRLNKDVSQKEIVEYRKTVSIPYKNGSFELSYFVLGINPSGSHYINNYCKKTWPVIYTLNGQKQGMTSAEFIRGDLKMPFLDPYMVIHIDCDNLDNHTKRDLFTSTRENLKISTAKSKIEQLIIDQMLSDRQLRKIHNERHGKTVAADKVSEKDLKKMVNILNQGGGTGATFTPYNFVPKPSPEPIELKEPADMFEIVTEKTVSIGRSFVLNFKSNALQKYFKNPDAITTVFSSKKFGQMKTFDYDRGYGKIFFQVNDNVREGYYTLEITLKAGRKELTATVELTAKEHTPSETTQRASYEIAVHNLDKDDPRFHTLSFTPDTTSDTTIDDDAKKADVYVNMENKHLVGCVAVLHKKGEGHVKLMKSTYSSQVAIASLRAERLHFNGTVESHQSRTVKKSLLENVLAPHIADTVFESVKNNVEVNAEIEAASKD